MSVYAGVKDSMMWSGPAEYGIVEVKEVRDLQEGKSD